jgi:membrane protease YdiL (CAAX protease family)
MVLLITLCLRFRPVTEPPIALRPSGTQHAIASVGIWIATVAAIVLFYFCLGSIFGSVSQVATQIPAFATDAKRLQGQPTPAWIIAIVRDCLIVPIFEEVFFRGVLLSWLRSLLNVHGAIFAMAALFALMHGSLVVAPYVFIFAVVAGYVRVCTGSTFNTIIMHCLNNSMLLYVGLRIFNGQEWSVGTSQRSGSLAQTYMSWGVRPCWTSELRQLDTASLLGLSKAPTQT